MNIPLFAQLHQKGLIEDITLEKIKLHSKEAPVAVQWDLLTLLYTGILLLTTAVGIIIYKNIDSIGQVGITILITITTLTCFTYCFKKAKGFSNLKVESQNVWFDYILLLGCLLMLVLIGYLQTQFNLFGNRWGLATFLPMVILFICAYYFDHVGVLSLAITNLATWVGLTISPLHLVRDNDFGNSPIIYSGVVLGIILIAASILSTQKNIKAHFSFTYKNFGTHLLFVACLAAVFVFGKFYLLWFIFLLAICFYQFRVAVKETSFYFLVITAIYFYIGVSYVVIRLLFRLDSYGDFAIYLVLIYLITSCIALVLLLMRYNKILKRNAGVLQNKLA